MYCTIKYDASALLYQVLRNLINNAVMYTPTGGLVVIRASRISPMGKDKDSLQTDREANDYSQRLNRSTHGGADNGSRIHYMRVEVQDSGPGISEVQ